MMHPTSLRRASLRHDRKCATAVLFALAAVPLLGFLGLAVDVGMLTLAKAQIDLAADSAALEAVTSAAASYTANPSGNYIQAGQTAGLSFFNAQMGKLTYGAAAPPTINVTRSRATFTSVVTTQVVVPSAFSAVFGYTSYPASTGSATTLTNNSFVAVQMLMDTSPSMGIFTDTVNSPRLEMAAVQSAVGSRVPVGGSNLVQLAQTNGLISVNNYAISPINNPGAQCAFACHDDNSTNGPKGNSNDFYGVAEANGLQLRIDVLRGAVQNIISQVQQSSNAAYFQFGLYGFSSQLGTIFPMSANLPAAYTAASNISITPAPTYCASNNGILPRCLDPNYPGDGGGQQFGFWRSGAVPATNFTVSATSLINNTLTPVPVQNGISAATPYRFLFLVTDGLDDYTTSPLNGACCNQFLGAVDTMDGYDNGLLSGQSPCDKIKAAGVTVLVLYTTYTEVPGDPDPDPWIDPQNNSLVTQALQACASPGNNYFQANSPAEIQAALNQMIAIASGSVARFTQ